MWTVMMVAMMVPAAAPMILAFGAIHRRRREAQQPTVAVAVAGYLVVWSAYAAAATLSQWGLHAAPLLSASMATTSAVLGDLQLTQYDDRGWRATFYTTGMEHSSTSATGTAWKRTPWRATQRAAWEVLRKADEPTLS